MGGQWGKRTSHCYFHKRHNLGYFVNSQDVRGSSCDLVTEVLIIRRLISIQIAQQLHVIV